MRAGGPAQRVPVLLRSVKVYKAAPLSLTATNAKAFRIDRADDAVRTHLAKAEGGPQGGAGGLLRGRKEGFEAGCPSAKADRRPPGVDAPGRAEQTGRTCNKGEDVLSQGSTTVAGSLPRCAAPTRPALVGGVTGSAGHSGADHRTVQGGRWICRQCTLENDPTAARCVACAHPRAQKAPTGLAGDWQCPMCTFLNARWQGHCEMCEHPK